MTILSKIFNIFLIMSQPRKTLIIILLFFIVLVAINCKIVFYGIEQGIGQLKIVNNSIPIDDILNDSTYPDSLKLKLLLVKEIKQFAIDSLGLKQSKNFNSIYDQKGQPIVWIIYAAPKFEMSVYEWHYPIIGDLPYTGYFDKEKALKEAEKMKNNGFDTRIGTVAAWSTLGYFKDPILSNALFQIDGDVAELVIHELTHATIFLKNKAKFNENLATFIGVEGAKLFLISKYGIDSKEYAEYIGSMKDSEQITSHILRGSKQLDSLYNSFTDNLNLENKEELKSEQIHKIINNIDTLSLFDTTIPQNFKNKIDKINNAYFAGFITYYDSKNEFEDEYFKSYYPDLNLYIKYLLKKYQN